MDYLYKIDENDNIRIWYMELEGANYRTHSGVQDGKIVISGWKTAKPKNPGKKNATTGEEQAVLEVARKYEEQLETGGYYKTIEEARVAEKFYFECMLAHGWKDEKHRVSFPVYEQPKLDGIRALTNKVNSKSRNGKPFVSTPHINEALVPVFEKYPDIILDGELYNHELKSDFEKIVSLVRKTKPTDDDLVESVSLVQYHIYDVFDPNRPNMVTSERQSFLSDIFAEFFLGDFPHLFIKQVPTTLANNDEELDEAYGNHLEGGYEGQMVRLEKAYEQKRSRYLLKRKEFEDGEYEILEVESGVGNWLNFAKRIWIKLPDGSIQKSGVRGTQEFLKTVLEQADEYVGTQVTVRYQGKTADNKLRFPVVTFFWKGKRDL